MQVLSRGAGQPSKVRVVAVTMRDGRFVPFDRDASAVVANDSLSATVRGARYSVPLSDLERVWIKRLNWLATTLVVVGVVGFVYATVELNKFFEGISEF